MVVKICFMGVVKLATVAGVCKLSNLHKDVHLIAAIWVVAVKLCLAVASCLTGVTCGVVELAHELECNCDCNVVMLQLRCFEL